MTERITILGVDFGLVDGQKTQCRVFWIRQYGVNVELLERCQAELAAQLARERAA